ncbi:LptF/LptG family permease [Aureimonas jatrophae]|jgi:lipopolysaccharide export system permease protein|uniref:Lipopolysaccharide export system permease protein n=1 Tax=Aureimonas jatrophae TaxID=1166073 RepID=A0A1H0G9U8_9HYPH|nr:LptF/LptG family permease [Aureimonas jatrophae]MBB3949480.1 lipopolysaccharide export system permease protein [Aureimonas jatrophae]SDO03685.1 lipopolysaccharide export system permease protein [Aureimonas jatrophae]
MKILERYIFRRALTFSAGALASLVLVVWIVQVLQRLDIVRTTATAAGDIFWIALMLMPDLAAGVLPFALLIGAIQTLNNLNADSERAVIAASGGSRKVIANPILLLGAVGALIVFVNSNYIGPKASSAFQNGVRAINADAISLFLQPGRFERVQDGLIMSIKEARGPNVRGLFLADTRDPALDLTYFAREATVVERLGQSYLVLDDGQLHRRDNTDGAVSIIEFQTYAFDLANLRPVDAGDWIRMSERSTRELLNPDPNDRVYQLHPNQFTEELAQRRTDFLYPIAFALWALIVAGHPRTNRQGPGAAMMLGLSGALVLKALGFVALSMVQDDVRTVWLVYALPLSAIAFDLWLYLFNVNVSELRWVRRSNDAVRRFGVRLMRLLPLAPFEGRTPGT